VDANDAVVGGLEKDRQDGIGETETRLPEGCPLMGRKSAWAAARAEVIALGVIVAGRGNWAELPLLKSGNTY
jgi:hypothetical protein